MKTLSLIFALTILSTIITKAQDQPVNPQDQINDEHPQPTAYTIQMEDLPAEVSSILNSNLYEGWNPLAAYLIREEDGAVFYAIEMEKDGERKTATIDREGREIERNLDNVFEEFESN